MVRFSLEPRVGVVKTRHLWECLVCQLLILHNSHWISLYHFTLYSALMTVKVYFKNPDTIDPNSSSFDFAFGVLTICAGHLATFQHVILLIGYLPRPNRYSFDQSKHTIILESEKTLD